MTITIQFVLQTLGLFALGSLFGSFLNVVIYRTMVGEDWIVGRSRCDHCGHHIRWFDNIPLFSFILLRGRCRDCQQSIDPTHLVVEFLTGVLFVWWFWFGSLFFQLTQAPFAILQPLFWLLVGVLLLMIVVFDFLYYIIPDQLVGLLLGLTIVYRIVLVWQGIMQPLDMILTMVAAALTSAFFFMLWFLTKGKGMGFGDVKLVFPLVLLLGWNKAFVGMFLAFLLGAVLGLVLIGFGKKRFGQVVPFGPFLVLGTFLSLIFAENLLQWYWSFLL